jgi:hypothetical protein
MIFVPRFFGHGFLALLAGVDGSDNQTLTALEAQWHHH